uniref:non-specific serine/threonine protein kinase n=1 Tax=Manihot esculenta TaxID=3983 RepID=A0A2C9UYG3_MANES
MATPHSPRPFGPRRYTYEELAEAAHHFSNRFLLGEGGFGQVYEGSLNGETFAIKKLRIVPDQETKEELEREIRFISHVSHLNLVKLVGYCMEGANGLLVLEYFPNRSLKVNLHERDVLDWPKRMKIAIGTARGLEYLHEYCKPKIIHQDIKPDNILIDSNFEPKIADFGLALRFPDSVSHISRSIMGTEVYADPEDCKRVSDKSDVYSFGIVLLELITGRKSKYQDIDIVKWAKNRIKEALEDEYKGFVDSKLQMYDKEQMKRMINCAAICVYNRPQFRPSIKKIVLALEGHMPLKNLWDGNNDDELPRIKEISSSGTERFQRIFTYEQLTAVTEGFSGKNLLVKGKQYQVYKGYLNGEAVTVKKFTYSPEKKEEMFEHIKSISSSVHHNNLVNMLGFCHEGPHRLLVYEFVSEDKSLGSHLHGNVKPALDWPTRMEVALRIARGMIDLHELYKPLNIFEQYKDEDIFLDRNFQPKVIITD